MEALFGMVDRCVDCGRRTSRGLKYCDSCRRIHFTRALNVIRQIRPTAGRSHRKPISTDHREIRLYFRDEDPARDGGISTPSDQSIHGKGSLLVTH
ncbi:MAG: hypothetical protein QXH16_03550 [Candidatus Bathyarchaeia archaeon]